MTEEEAWLVIRKEHALAFGKRVPNGFLVRAGSTAMREGSPIVKRNRAERDHLVSSGVLVPDDNPALFRFAVDHVFSSISAAAGVVIDGNSNGDHWKEDNSVTAVTTDLSSLQTLLSLLTRKEIDAAMSDCEALGLNSFLARGGFVRPQVWVKSGMGSQSYPAKAIVAAALGYLPDGRALSAKEFFNGFGETQAFARLKKLGYEISRKGTASNFGDLSREEIEAAMDAYDAYKTTGEHADIFRSFGDPRDYWVRSTRDRQSRVYPSKPLVGFISKKTVLNGGWGQKSDAAARLHNSGFIIVDRDDRPIPPPERYDHLMGDADRIRLCALNYYIEPARERSSQSVSIAVNDLAVAMALKDRFPNICQTLGGKKFQQLANVPVPTHTEPNPSSSTIFTYKLGAQAETDSLKEVITKLMPAASNLILYGPPGTGKTYHTAWEAVRLCLGEAATGLQEPDKRKALMAEYRRLVDAQRIEFVTFHQSMSYEEFVEGLRPSTDEDVVDGAFVEKTSVGFHLKPFDGVFKRICERAERDVGEPGNLNRFDRSRRIIRLGLTGSNWREKLEIALQEHRIEWPHGGDVDWSPPEYDSWEAIKAKRQEKEPDVLGNHPTVYGTWLFRGAEAGEYVALTVGKGKIVALGRLNGEYSFQPGSDGRGARHIRTVEWLWHDAAGVDRDGIYSKEFTSFHTAYPLLKEYLNWDGLDHAVFGERVPPQREVARPYVLIIDEINRANISKVFGELITLLEPDKRLGMTNEIRLTLPYSKKSFGVPANLHIIGTMNTADRSIALLDTALRRRFTFRELMPEPAVLAADAGGINLQKLLRTINERIEYVFDREHQIGHAYFTGCATRDDVEAVMRHKVIPLLAEYFYEDWSKVAAVLGDTKQDKPRFLVREDMTAPEGMESDSFAGPRQRWRVKPERDSSGNEGFDFTEFEA